MCRAWHITRWWKSTICIGIYGVLGKRNALTVASGHGSTKGEENFISTDKLYLLSTREVWGKERISTQITYDTADGEEITRQLDCYATYEEERYTVVSASSYSDDFFYPLYDGRVRIGIYAHYSYGVSPVFRIG